LGTSNLIGSPPRRHSNNKCRENLQLQTLCHRLWRYAFVFRRETDSGADFAGRLKSVWAELESSLRPYEGIESKGRNMLNRTRRLSLPGFLLPLLLVAVQAHASPIDLGDFFADPTVTVAADGSTATLAEDPSLSPVLLVNNPGFGDPNVIIPGINTFLEFNYVFNEPVLNEDEFGVFVIDATTGSSAGMAYEFFLSVSGSGFISFDLTSLVGKILGLQFQLSSFFADAALTSTVEISNVQLVERVVPVPSTIFLLGLGLLGIVLKRRSTSC
jgi:hypothetical protein